MTNTPSTLGAGRKTLIFHIGDHKAGSTSIQMAFAQDQVRLAGKRIFYPAKIALNMLRKHCEAYAQSAPSPKREAAIGVFQTLGDRLKMTSDDYCLVSAEGFETIDPAVFREILESYWSDGTEDIRIVAYVRPHAARVLSSFAERVKIGGAKVIDADPETFFQQMRKVERFHYFPRFSAWRAQFGDRFLLRPMIRGELLNGSVVDDFVYHAFDGTPFTLTGNGRANESLSLEDLMRLKVVQSHMRQHSQNLRHVFGWEFARVIGKLPPAASRTKLQLHKALAREIRETYLADARAMDQSFFDGRALLETELQLAVEAAIETAQSVTPEHHLSDEELRGLAALSEIISGLLENEGDAWPAFLHNRRVKDVRIAARGPSDGHTSNS